MPPPFNALINAIWCAKTENSLTHTISDDLLTVLTVNIFSIWQKPYKITFEMMKDEGLENRNDFPSVNLLCYQLT